MSGTGEAGATGAARLVTVGHGAGDRPSRSNRKLNHVRCAMRALARMRADPDDPHHGTPTGYNYGCRCERCREAKRATYTTEEYRARRRHLDRIRKGHA